MTTTSSYPRLWTEDAPGNGLTVCGVPVKKVGALELAPGYVVVVFDRPEGYWSFHGYTKCNPGVTLDGSGWMQCYDTGISKQDQHELLLFAIDRLRKEADGERVSEED